ncbi:sugar kinase [Nocardia sp. SYP-A9097]|uniref:PfkB family carbohydrate kinase n=1 Tax=Nocardia sp. SYP-A9097 TaxID=2663237 RepID=UPI00129AB4AA|nr:PfkB family carbohydrate kinase [Nocardia sp. SYP-A9097]MRH90440.1 sugar kinase [Nocardia sp. SYP-A9097]
MDDNGAVFIGLSTLDLAYAVDRYPAEDSKTQADELFLGAGGPAANAAVTYAHLSGRVPTLVTALGKHPLAELIRGDLQQHGVGLTDLTPDGEHQPPVSSIIVATGAATRTIVSLDGSRVYAPFDSTAAEHLDRVGIVLVDGHYPEPALHIAAAAKAQGIPVVLDAGRRRPVHTELLPLTDIAICSAAFTPPGVPPNSAPAVFEYLHALGIGSVAITRGADPVLWSSAGASGEIPITATAAVDTLGAGDILHGAFCHFHTLGESFPRALTHAAEIASRSCASVGTRAWMR